ncbi:MAG: HDOD domain-containing protein [Deltaproteobacteria bacterium]|nr:HDOD domain-containing protein [Deltaproteobacteria bacterium]
MTFASALTALPNALAAVNPAISKALHPALVGAARAKGEFPSSLGLVEKLRLEIGSDAAKPETVARLASSSPLMALRIVAVANSAFYVRGNPVETLESAVNHLGLKRLQGIVEDEAEKKSFQATFLGRAVASGALQQALIANILARSLAEGIAPRSTLADRAFILSSLLRVPSVLLAFLRPSLYSACCLDVGELRSPFERNFKKFMGESSVAIAVAISEALSFPLSTATMLSYLELPPWNRRGGGKEDVKDSRQLAYAVFIAQRLADEICRFGGYLPLDSVISDLSAKSDFEDKQIKLVIGELPQRFLAVCSNLGLRPSRLPSYLSNFESKMVGRDGKAVPDAFKFPGIAERINPFLYELKACLNTRTKDDEFGQVPQAILCTLQALVKGLTFDRAIFFRHDEVESCLIPVAVFGDRPQDANLVRRSLGASGRDFMPDVQALLQRKTIFQGDPIFNDDWPLAAFPVTCNGKVEGVFFADKLGKKNALPLDTQEQVAVVALAEGWHELSPQFR